MKRCPTCHRVETDEALAFCRADGTPLVSDSGSVSADAGRMKFGSSPVASEIETSVLPQHATDADINRATGPTTVLDRQQTIGGTRELARPKRTKTIVFVGAAVFIAAIAVSAYFYLSRKSNAAIQSVAVLPFTNASGNADVEYLSDGITESLINSLSQLPNLSVKARSTVFHYKGKDVTPQQVGSELSVQAVLNGRFAQRGDQLTLSLELVDARTGNQIWGEQYNRKTADLVSLQSEIARDVSNKLRVKLSGADEQKLAKNYTVNAEAYQLYLKGRYFWNKRTSDGIKKSIEYFNQAIEKDPTYALAYAGLADAYEVLPSYSQTPSKEVYPKAKAAAMKALALDDNVAEAHTSLAMVRFWYDWGAGAEPEFKRGLELNPNYATGHHWYSLYLSAMGRHNEAIAEMKRAQELDPFSIIINTELGLPYLYTRQYDQAIEQFKKAIEMDPNFAFAHFGLANAYDRKGKYQEAIAEHQKAIELAHGEAPPAWSVLTGQLQEAHKASGEKGYWQKRLDLTKRLYDQGAATAEAVAEIYAILGDKDQAFAWLEKSYQQHEDFLVFLKIQPEFDSLRSDRRYTDLVRRVGLPQ